MNKKRQLILFRLFEKVKVFNEFFLQLKSGIKKNLRKLFYDEFLVKKEFTQ